MTGPRARSLTALALALPMLAGCAAGLEAQTYNERVAADVSQGETGSILLNGVSIDPRSSSRVEADATVFGHVAIANMGREDDRLVSVSSPDADDIEIVGPTGDPTTSLVLPAGGQVLLTRGGEARGFLRISGLSRSIAPGEALELTFSFESAPDVTVQAPVRLPDRPQPRETPAGEGEGEEGH